MGKSLRQRYRDLGLKIHDKRLASEATKREKLKEKEILLDARIKRDEQLKNIQGKNPED